jgi:hypothetical protein
MNLIEAWENMDFLIAEISAEPKFLILLTEIALNSDHPKSWRAAWILDKIHEKNKLLIVPFIPLIIDQLKIEKNEGKKRHLLKLVSQNTIPEHEKGFLLEYCIATFTTAKEPIAVRVHAMQVLYEISQTEPGLKPEILAIIENELEEHSTAGIRSRGIKITGKLRRQIAGFTHN